MAPEQQKLAPEICLMVTSVSKRVNQQDKQTREAGTTAPHSNLAKPVRRCQLLRPHNIPKRLCSDWQCSCQPVLRFMMASRTFKTHGWQHWTLTNFLNLLNLFSACSIPSCALARSCSLKCLERIFHSNFVVAPLLQHSNARVARRWNAFESCW